MLELLALEITKPEPFIKLETETKQTQPKEVQENPKPITHVVQKGENLSKIAKAHGTTWQRLFYKNTDIKHPDQLEVGSVLEVPEDKEKLKERHYTVRTVKPVKTAVRASSGTLNTYDWGQCTWYVKNTLSWVQNGWRDAGQWGYNSGHPVSSTPVVGAVAWTTRGYYGHVGVVEQVKGNKVYISEMNVKGVGVLSYDWYPISSFQYIIP